MMGVSLLLEKGVIRIEREKLEWIMWDWIGIGNISKNLWFLIYFEIEL